LRQVEADVAHDINNPLAWVPSNLSLLEQYEAPISTVVCHAAESAKGLPQTGELEERG